MSILVDSYSETNQDSQSNISAGAGDNQEDGQSFTGIAGVLNSATFYLKKTGSPTGNITYKIYAHSGTFGTSSVPTGAALATSDTYSCASLTTSYQLITLNFTGANKITLVAGTKYILVAQFGGGDITNNVQVGIDASSPSHAGNHSGLRTAAWTAQSGNDSAFYVYVDNATNTGKAFLNMM